MAESKPMVDREVLRDWISSYSGCDGGNVKAETWLCGVEWGGTADKDYYQKKLVDDINNGPQELPSKPLNWLKRINEDDYTYDETFVMVHAAMRGKKYSGKDGYAKKEVIDNHAKEMTDNNEVLKLNLSPIGFSKINEELWDEFGLEKVTGIGSRSEFVDEWLMSYRSELFTALRKRHQPKRIICIGICHRDYFLKLFGFDKFHERVPIRLEQGGSARSLYWAKLDDNSKTKLFVMPFSSPKGLNYHNLREKFGEKIAELSGSAD